MSQSPASTRAVLFDLDGTLVDTIELLLSSVQHAFAHRQGRAPTRPEWIAGIGTPLASQLQPFASDEDDLQALMVEYRTYQRTHHDRLTRCYDDVLPTVQQLHGRGHPLAVVTSKTNDLARRTLEHVGLAPYMDAVIGLESTERHKPDPDPVRAALTALDARAADAVFVGDSPHDMAAGNAAGVTTIAALWGPFERDVLKRAAARFTLDRMSGLPALLDRLAVAAVA
jgi:pyrophosphatase PpaX